MNTTQISVDLAKSVEQQAIAALHRLRQGALRARTARINALRGHLREFGILIPVGATRVVRPASIPPAAFGA